MGESRKNGGEPQGRRSGRATLEDIFRVARAPELQPEEKVLWLIYRSYESPNGKGAYPGDELLAEHLDRSPRSVQSYRARLLEKGWLERELRGPRPARWRAVLPEKASQPTAKQSLEAGCDPSKASQEASQSASPEYGENRRYSGKVRYSTSREEEQELEEELEEVEDELPPIPF